MVVWYFSVTLACFLDVFESLRYLAEPSKLISPDRKLALSEASTFKAEDLSSMESDATISKSLLGWCRSFASFSKASWSQSVRASEEDKEETNQNSSSEEYIKKHIRIWKLLEVTTYISYFLQLIRLNNLFSSQRLWPM